jgi:competence protein ComEA
MKYLLALIAFITFNAFAEPVNINTADAETIANSLNGIGIKKAEAIIEHRTKEGDFKSVDDLAKVKGIGEKTVEKNKADIILTSPTKK